jgi:hypothetical protein
MLTKGLIFISANLKGTEKPGMFAESIIPYGIDI